MTTASAHSPQETATKAHFAGGSGSIGAAISMVLAYVFDMPMEVAVAVAIIVTGAIGWLTTYWSPANRVIVEKPS